MKKKKPLLTAAALVLALAAAFVPHATAQIDPMKAPYYIYESGKMVGVIYVPDRASKELYIEHWVLFPNYVYPSGTNGQSITIVANTEFRIDDEKAFFRSVPWGEG